MIDSIWFIGFCFIVFCVAITVGVSLTSIVVAAHQIYHWAKRGKLEEGLDLQAIQSERHAIGMERQ